ncbi:MAG: adenosylcobalamin-dependent ribonucleoside-diphosphate reductase [Bdellovibrionales bacterium]
MAETLRLERHFTKENESPFASVNWRPFAIPGWDRTVEGPAHWSPTAVEIAATRYLRPRFESSVRALLTRVVRALRAAGEWQGYFAGAQAQVFEDELMHILVHQLAAFNSPVYFNVGVFPQYGILGRANAFACDPNTGEVGALASAYVRPQASACFIQDVQDDLISIYELLMSEAKLFKYGSGSGTNFSRLRARGEALDLGGESTGLLSYLEVFDKSAQAIRSGGATRRAAKMVVVDADHPEILEFIRWKKEEERKARVLLSSGYSGGMDGEAFRTVSGQNSNNSVRVTDDFLRRAQHGELWALRSRRSGEIVSEVRADEIVREIARAAWECADPGIQYHDTIQKWHVCPKAGPIRASNPCSEYMFLDNSACNLASLNLARFLRDPGTKSLGAEPATAVDWNAFTQTARILLLTQEILVNYASYPTREIAENSYRFRPLGLGYANLGGALMQLGVGYESEAAVMWTRRFTGALHAVALRMSCELAKFKGPFSDWVIHKPDALNVLNRHRQAWGEQRLNQGLEWVDRIYEDVSREAERSGLRHAQLTLLAPTGTIGLLMDCDTLGIEPDFALVKRKHLAVGGDLLLVNQSVTPALRRLGYTNSESADIISFVLKKGTIVGAPGFKAEHEPVFDCALAPPAHPHRRISWQGHLEIMSAAQPFLSGAISKTINLPNAARIEDVEKIFLEGWHRGLKSISIYRDGSKTLQPLCAEC